RVVDRRVRRDAGAPGPRRLHADGPRHPPGSAGLGAARRPGPTARRQRGVAPLAQLRNGPLVGASRFDHRNPCPTTERTSRMTTETVTMPYESPIGGLVLECDGDVLIGIWLPH